MASGKPVIGTAVDGIPEVIGTESGILVPRGDASALADAIFRLLSDAGLAAAMGQAGRKRAREKFNVRGAVRRMEELYIELLESANG
jgi:glycosyltransferase involved in cell wall biosynthesis